MNKKFVVVFLAIIITFSSGCVKKSPRGTAATTCNYPECIKKICPNYSVNENISYDGIESVCKTGNCSIPNMKMVFQLNNNIPHEDKACGPVATHVALNSMIANSTSSVSSWLNQYSQITADSTESSDGSCSNIDCRRIVFVGDKLINDSWTDEGQEVAASQVSKLFENEADEISRNAESYESNEFPGDIDGCNFITGECAITNNQKWNHVLLYLRYLQVKIQTSTKNGVPLVKIGFDSSNGGHFITMNGYDVRGNGIFFKFHCPIYGEKWYEMRQVKLNEPFCVSQGTGCTYWHEITELPPGFHGNKATYIIENPGEEAGSNYVYKFIVAISGILSP